MHTCVHTQRLTHGNRTLTHSSSPHNTHTHTQKKTPMHTHPHTHTHTSCWQCIMWWVRQLPASGSLPGWSWWGPGWWGRWTSGRKSAHTKQHLKTQKNCKECPLFSFFLGGGGGGGVEPQTGEWKAVSGSWIHNSTHLGMLSLSW